MSAASIGRAREYAVRDYLNAGGKLVHAGETAQFEGLPGISTVVGGLYYGLNGDPSAECVISPRPGGSTAGFFEDCLQYDPANAAVRQHRTLRDEALHAVLAGEVEERRRPDIAGIDCVLAGVDARDARVL